MSLHSRWSTLRELCGRHASAFGHAWRRRHALRSGFFNQQEAEFLPAALALQENPDSPSLRWSARILMALVLTVLLWSVLGHLDIVVNASGRIIPSMRTQTIASVDIASVVALHVVEGQAVRAGDLLVELDSSGTDAEHDKAVDVLAQARLQVARSQGLITAVRRGGRPRLADIPGVTAAQHEAARQQLADQYRDFGARLARLDGEIAHHAAAAPLAARRAEDFRALLEDRDVSRHAWLEKEQARIDIEGQLIDARNQRAALIAQTLKEARDALLEGEKAMAASAQDARRAGERSRLLKLVAPVDGVVQQLAVHTVGGVVPATQPLMQIVPAEHRLEVQAMLENKDMGFVHEGQTAAVKIDAFDYTRYGTVPAIVGHVSQDAIQDDKKGLVYSAKVTLERDDIEVDGRSSPLSAGMSVDVEIRTGTRRVIDYVLSPLMRHRREALHER